jgi:hypothetical protein
VGGIGFTNLNNTCETKQRFTDSDPKGRSCPGDREEEGSGQGALRGTHDTSGKHKIVSRRSFEGRDFVSGTKRQQCQKKIYWCTEP